MVGELIKEYLVGLGVQIDKPGFREMESTINRTSSTIASATGGWAKNFVTASGIIVTALASVSTAVVGLMAATAKQDLAMEKYARQMLVSKGAAMEMKMAIDALGESVNDIQLTPELFDSYKDIVSDGRKMKIGGDFEGTMKEFRGLMFEFTRLKQEASYAMQWVGYYLMKHLAKPLSDAKSTFKSFNDGIIKNMPVWTEKVAQALVYVVNIGKHFLDLLKSIGKSIYEVWDAFPRGIKIATAALAGFFTILKVSPLWRMVALVGSLLLLVDDYFGYMEGKNAAMGGVWDKLNGYIDTAKRKMIEWGNASEPVWDSFVECIIEAKDGVIEFGEKCIKWFDEIGQSKSLNDFLDTAERLGKALWKLGEDIIGFVVDSFKALSESMDKQGTAKSFTILMEKLWDIFLKLIDAISYCCETVGDWLRELGNSQTLRDFIDACVELGSVIMELINAFFELCDVALVEFFGGVKKTEPVYSFRDALRDVVEMITDMVRGISKLVKALAELFDMMKDNKTFKDFWKGLGEVAKGFFDIVMKALGAVGRLGQALMALVSKKYDLAGELAGEAMELLFGSKKAEAGGRRKGNNGFTGTGDEKRDAYILEASERYGVPAHKIAGMIEAESTFREDAKSEAGAMGYMQLMPSTFKWMGFEPADILDPYKNIMAGTKYMAYLRDYYDGNWDKVYGSYNCGPGAFDDYLVGNKPLPEESRNHIEKVNNFEKKYISDDIPYTIQDGVEDKDLNGTDAKLLGTFEDFAYDAKSKGYAIEVTSGWRSEENNARVGGVPNSKHRGKGDIGTGEAIDFIVKGDFKQEDVEKLAKQYGLKVLYHDVGSGLHFHVQIDPDAPQYEIKNPSGNERDPNWFDYAKESAGKAVDGIGSCVSGMAGWFKDRVGDLGGIVLDASKGLQTAASNVDPITTRNLMSQSVPTNYYTNNNGSTVSVVNHVSVGGVTVQSTNASPVEIGKEVAGQTVQRLENEALYFQQNRSWWNG